MNNPKTLMIFSNGNVAAFDEHGQQMGELQSKGTIDLYLEFLESKGVDPTKIGSIELQTPNGLRYLKPYKCERGWNYSINEF